MSKITDEEVRELGIDLVLFRKWEQLMGDLYKIYLLAKLSPQSVENEIHIGKWRIYIDFVNNKFLQGNVYYEEQERLTVRHVGSDKLFACAINSIIQP
jgi:hypothetical protein